MQGVGFRNFVQTEAVRLGLAGFVRNDPQDRRRLEVVAEGRQVALEALLNRVTKGPIWARVDTVQTGWEPAQATFQDFKINYL